LNRLHQFRRDIFPKLNKPRSEHAYGGLALLGLLRPRTAPQSAQV
jgi:hypothetical protein